MNPSDGFDRSVSTWLHADADHRVPEHLDEVLRRTSTERQRPAWSSLERWLPLDTSISYRGRIMAKRSLVWVVVLLAIVLAIAGAVIFTGELRPSAPFFGLASNGRIIVADGTSLRSYAADGTDPKVVLDLPNGATGLTVSPDGSRLAYNVPKQPAHIEILRVDGGSPVSVPLPGTLLAGDQISWSPASDRIVFLAIDAAGAHVYIAPTDGSAASELGAGTIPTADLWWPAWSPDGIWISFLGADGGDPGTGSIYLIHPDGTGFHRLETSLVSVGDVGGGVWSPDPVVQRLLYVTPGNSLRMIDLAAAHELIVGGGFWPIWSPDGNRISFWSDGTQVRSTADALAEVQRNVRTFPAVPGNCRDHPDLANKAFCGPATWSPDGTRLISADVVGRSAVSLLADGTGSPIVMPLGSQIEGTPLPIAAWLPIRP